MPRHQASAKAGRNYHVILGEDWVNYSVPHTNIGKRRVVSYDTNAVEVFLEQTMKRIAIHKRATKSIRGIKK